MPIPRLSENLITNFILPHDHSAWRRIYLISKNGTLRSALEQFHEVSRDALVEHGLPSDQWTYIEALRQWHRNNISVDLGLIIWHLRSETSTQHPGLRRHRDSSEVSVGTSIRYLQIVGQILERPMDIDHIALSCHTHITAALTEQGAIRATGGIPDMGTTARALKALTYCSDTHSDTATAIRQYILANKAVANDRAWSAVRGGPPVTGATALAVDALLLQYSTFPSDVRRSICDGIRWLVEQQNEDGGWSETTAIGNRGRQSPIDVTFWVARALKNGTSLVFDELETDDALQQAADFAANALHEVSTSKHADNSAFFASRLATVLQIDTNDTSSKQRKKITRLSHMPDSDMYSFVAVQGLLEVERRNAVVDSETPDSARNLMDRSVLPSVQPAFLRSDASIYDYLGKRMKSRYAIKAIDLLDRWQILELLLGIVLGGFFTLVTLASNVIHLLTTSRGIYLAYCIIVVSAALILLDLALFVIRNLRFGLLRIAMSTLVGGMISVAALQAQQVALASLSAVSTILLSITVMNVISVGSDQLKALTQVAHVLDRQERTRIARRPKR